jgi:hypothetical protein
MFIALIGLKFLSDSTGIILEVQQLFPFLRLNQMPFHPFPFERQLTNPFSPFFWTLTWMSSSLKGEVETKTSHKWRPVLAQIMIPCLVSNLARRYTLKMATLGNQIRQSSLYRLRPWYQNNPRYQGRNQRERGPVLSNRIVGARWKDAMRT